MKKNKGKLIIFIVLLLAFIVRFYKLASFPALNADEAAVGYNAYSLLETGKDEHGNSWPIHFQSFNDYKPGFYVYLVMPFVRILGLNEWAVRIPGAFLSICTIYIVYLLVQKLFKKERLALFTGLLLTISPWHIHFSRGGWEVNAATFLIALGLYLFIKALKKSRYYYFSILIFSLSLYTYHAARIIVPILGLALLIIYWKDIRKNLKTFILSVLLGVFLLIPLGIDMTKSGSLSRVSGVGLLADSGPINKVNEQRGEHKNINSPFSKIIHNKAINYSLAFLENWSEHFDGEYLFLSGDDIQRNKVPETGQIFLIGFPFLILGLIYIIKFYERNWSIIIIWLFISPFAAAFTFQSPHALRSQNMVVPTTIIISFGLYKLFEVIEKKLKNKFFRVSSILIIFLAIIWQFAMYVHMYWVHMAKEYPYSSQYGVKELVEYVSENHDKYKQVVVTDRYDQPYILFLFYLKYPPEAFQNEHVLTQRDQYGFSTVREFNKYVFISITNWDKLREEYRDSLIAGTDEEIFYGTNVVKRIYFPNGEAAFEVIAN
ncbi:ArnT family glycosyltransferase [Patescibacteria group bacterium]